MGLFDIIEDIFGKHHHHKDPTVQELLKALKLAQENLRLSEHNEHHLQNNLENALKQNRVLQHELYKCMNKKPHGARYDVVF